MFRLCMILAALLAPLAAQAAEPGSGLPIFRRNTKTTPQATPPREQTPQAAPQSEAPKVVGVSSERASGDEVDVAEVLRRGDRVVVAGRGPMDLEDAAIGATMAPPPDDSHKWFFSIIVDDSRESQALLYDLKHSEHLRAWINLDEPKQSWSHATVYVAKDQTQDWRWAKLKISRYPVMILQPPAKLVDESKSDSWQWGDPKTVVWQWDGYDSTSPNRAKLRSDAIRKVLTAYVQAVQSKRDGRLAGPRAAAPAATPGARQAGAQQGGDIGGPPPFQLPRLPDASGGAPVFPADPTFPAGPASPSPAGLADLISAILERVIGWKSVGFWSAMVALLKLIQMIAPLTKNKIDDKIAKYSAPIVGVPLQPQTPAEKK